MKQTLRGVILGIMLAATACSATSYAKTAFGFTENDHWTTFSLRMSDRITDYVDDQTGVHYLVVFDDSSMNAICPRYTKDGEIMIDEQKGNK